MRTIQQLIHLSVLLSFLSTITYSTDYYVDNTASGGNNGTSWTNAWQSFSAINWGSIQPGDYLYVSGGSDSTIYYEDMVVGTSGTSGNQITIIAGKYAPSPSGHSGRVIIDGENHSRLYAIHLDYRSYITIKGFEVRDHERGIAIRHDAVGCIIDSNRVTNFTEQGGIRIDGSGSTCNPADWTSSDHIIKNNIVISPEDVPTQCDGIYIQRCQDILIHNNYVHNRNRSVVNSHTDGIQTHCVMNLKFTNNVVIADSNAIGMPMVIRAESDGVGDADSVIFYNNLFYGGGLWFDGAPWVNCIDHQSDWGPSGVEPYTIMIHNTIISHGPFYAPVWKERHSETEKHLMINNIVAQFGDGVTGVPSQYHGIFRNSAGAWVVDNTLGGFYYCEWGDFDPMNTVTGNGNTGGCSSWSEWVNTYGGTGIFSNPLFVSPIGYIEDEGIITGELQLNSPAINAGVDIQAIVEGMGLPWADINGNPRDNTPTIGAWEYDAGPDLTPPTVTGASLLDSITLKITFSEPLDPSTAQNPNNHSINNGITVVSALLTGSVVTLTTSPHASGTYTVTVLNVEDIAGNIVSPTANSADYDWTVIQDVTPPELIGVQIVEADKVVLDFSEPLDASQVSNLGNYIISEQMQVLVAELNTTQTRICLTTEEHLIEHIYTIEIHNLTDLAGNVISAQANSIFYKQLDLGQVDYFEYLMESVGASATTDTNTSPQKTLDGLVNGDPDPNSRWAAEFMPQWIQYDLGSVNNITLIASSFYNWNVGRIYQYSIQISEDGNQWNEVVTNQSSSSQEWTFNEMTQLTYARYVRIICLSNNQANWAGLWEARILGPSQVPVELLSFSAEVSDVNNVVLSWTTATETNCNSFEIERKTRNSDFLTIETVPGHGTTTEHHIYHITDRDLEFGFYIYRLKQIDFNGQSFYFNEIEVEVKGPEGFKLEQNYPNPFNPITTIAFSVPKRNFIKLSVFNAIGKEVTILIQEEVEPGAYKITFNAANLPSGIYFYKLQSANFIETRKMVLLK